MAIQTLQDLIAAAWRVEHYEIATDVTLCALAAHSPER